MIVVTTGAMTAAAAGITVTMVVVPGVHGMETTGTAGIGGKTVVIAVIDTVPRGTRTVPVASSAMTARVTRVGVVRGIASKDIAASGRIVMIVGAAVPVVTIARVPTPIVVAGTAIEIISSAHSVLATGKSALRAVLMSRSYPVESTSRILTRLCCRNSAACRKTTLSR